MAAADSWTEILHFCLELLGFVLKVLIIVVTATANFLLPKKKKDLAGEVVLVTGSAQGMGSQLALQIARLGAKVVLWDINEVSVAFHNFVDLSFMCQ
ncbi:epidermal retinol dehydrogenase 2 [Trichonephila clavata]|uniref:Epidermal retinol dehydrogenase 2 n=1 Tax=Trichonephila clavata TaxID=2740835 RepID=A0A8X6HZ71_TRICU|nr:epidermal retinol dehydrogenase 2 [Trichonephila clavata]